MSTPREETTVQAAPQPESVRPPLTPRQDRIEASIVRLLRAGATRSALRDAVYAYADLMREQGAAPERALAQLKAIARQATPAISARAPHSAGDSPDDRMAMIVRWCSVRFFQVD